ncbi:MAG: LysM peptidoglycan-binding domain-containing protein [Deltaproteobacteria bacterium]|nr:LysM peptidoglycan-binding domain-containing protein [Deltaproteobacteria bacterium]
MRRTSLWLTLSMVAATTSAAATSPFPTVVARPAAPPDPALEAASAAVATFAADDGAAPDEDDAEEDDDGVDPESELLDGGVAAVDGHRYSADLSDEQLKELWAKRPEQLGSLSVGFTESGSQLNAVQFPTEGGPWLVVNPHEAWGAKETIDYVVAAAQQVADRMPGGPPLRVNDISKKDGGWLRPHKSHQSGRDVDLGLFYPDNAKCSKAREKCMDVARNWALVRALVTTGDVQMLLVDKRIQASLYEHALSIGEDKGWLDSLFHGPEPLLKHASRHRDHFHVRYYAPRSQELGRRVQPLLAMRPEHNLMLHRIRSGDSLGKIASKYGTTVNALKKANGMKNTFLRAGRTLRIPLRGPCTSCPVPPPVVVPPRRLPPDMLTTDKPTPLTAVTAPPAPVLVAVAQPVAGPAG